MNNQLPEYFIDWKPELPRVCTRYEIRSPVFHLPLIRHKFAENSLRYCLIKQLNMEKCSVLITSKVHVVVDPLLPDYWGESASVV